MVFVGRFTGLATSYTDWLPYHGYNFDNELLSYGSYNLYYKIASTNLIQDSYGNNGVSSIKNYSAITSFSVSFTVRTYDITKSYTLTNNTKSGAWQMKKVEHKFLGFLWVESTEYWDCYASIDSGMNLSVYCVYSHSDGSYWKEHCNFTVTNFTITMASF
jgi:hypothetical protein